MPKLKPGTFLPTLDEEREIQAGIDRDLESRPLTDAEWQEAQPRARIGRPPSSEHGKQPVTIRLDVDVVNMFKRTGNGWQTRMNAALRQYLVEHPM
jgi:uncharacterized protein (DUF4415 family)